jgi:hypothetical protein
VIGAYSPLVIARAAVTPVTATGAMIMTKPSRSFKFVRHTFVAALGISGFFTIAPMPGSAAEPLLPVPQPNIYNVYMANASNSNCPSVTDGNTCTATFPAVPSGQKLTVTNVSCIVATVTNATPFLLTLVGAQPTFLTTGTGTLFDGTAYYQSTFSVLSVSNAGQTPQVSAGPLAFTTSMSINCTIAGYLTGTL